MIRGIRAGWILVFVTGFVIAEGVEPSVVNSSAAIAEALAAAKGQAMLLRIRADWDLSDSEMDEVYASPCIQELLSEMAFVVADITDNTDDHKELLEHYQVFGPPWAMVFDANGRRVPGSNVIGYASPYRLAERVREALDLESIPESCEPKDIE